MIFFRRGQAAVEFLTTYGWAFMVVLSVFSGLGYFGVLDPDGFVSDRCVVGSPFVCEEFVVGSDGFLVGLRHGLSDRLMVSEFFYFDETGSRVLCDDFDEVEFGSNSLLVVGCGFNGSVVLDSSFGFGFRYRSLSDSGDSFGRDVVGDLRVSQPEEGGVLVGADGGSTGLIGSDSGDGGVTNPLADSNCYDPGNVGSVGSWPGCDGMLIVDNGMLSGALGFQIEHNGDFYTFGNSSLNVFTGQVTDMSNLFNGASSFNQDIGYWDTSSVTNMREMFRGASSFNSNISGWDTSSVVDMAGLFYEDSAFDQDLSSWDTSSVVDMAGLFYLASSFNRPINSWNTGSVINMTGLFMGASLFNHDIGSWDVSDVTTMDYMFAVASNFDQNISSWDVGKVTDMQHMFFRASNFNQDISSWNVTSVNDMVMMFADASSFNQNISSWCVENIGSTPTGFSAGSGFAGQTELHPRFGYLPMICWL
jgi:surface protein